MSDTNGSLERGLGRVEARVSELSTQIASLREELTLTVHTMREGLAGHHERINSLESFRKWMTGLMTGLLMSIFAAALGWVMR